MYECHNCHKQFNSNRHLKYHLAFNPKHKDDIFDHDEYLCPECGEDCDDKIGLSDHIDYGHDDDDSIGDILEGIGIAGLLGELSDDESLDDSPSNDDADDFSGFGGGEMDGGGSDDSW